MAAPGEDSKIAVLIADDSYLWASTLTEILAGDPDLRVLDRVGDGRQAVEVTARRQPDLVLMDLRMPVLDGLGAISRIMARRPTPILAITGDPGGDGGELAFEALRRGALDLMVKDVTYPPPPEFVAAVRRKVKALAGVRVVRHVDPRHREARPRPERRPDRPPIRVVAIVASTGGPAALAAICRRLPADFGAGIVVVQHLASGFAPSLAGWLDGLSPLSVQLARSGDLVAPGRVAVAPDCRHLVVRPGGRLHLDAEPPHRGHCPSGDLLLASVARAYGPAALGVVLTGMGDDGAQGLARLRRAGGRTLAQDPASAAISGMPRAAFEAGAVEGLVSLEEIAPAVVRLVNDAAAPGGSRKISGAG